MMTATSTEMSGSAGVQPVVRMIGAGDDRAGRAEQVAHHVDQRATHVEVVAVAAVEQQEHADIDQEAEDGDAQHGAAHHRLRRHQAARCLDDDAAGDNEKHQAVAEGDQHLQSFEAVGALVVRGPARKAEGEPGEEQAGEIGQHVAGVGEQRQRAGDQAAGRLYHHETAGDERRPEQAAFVVAVAVAVPAGMAMAVVVAHRLRARLLQPACLSSPST